MKTITKYFILSLFFALPIIGNSAHIVGGTFSYKVINSNNGFANVEVILYLYRDGNSSGALFDQNIELGLYRYIDSEYSFVSRQSVSLSSSAILEVNSVEGCPNDIIQYEIGTYITQMTIPTTNAEYFTIGYQRCCRDNLISNIQNPEETGIAISFDIFPFAFSKINQPVFMNHQWPGLIEVGIPSSFDLSIEDEFGKEYMLSTPQAAGGVLGSSVAGDPFDCEGITPDVENCQPEFDEVEYVDVNNPYGPGATIEIDKESGIIEIDIPAISKVLVGLTIDYYSQGEILSRIRQQFIVNSLDCSATKTTDLKYSDMKMWPSPTQNKIYFEQQLTDVSIFDFYGNEVNHQQNKDYVKELDLNNLSEGIYIIKGKTKEGFLTMQKVIKLN